MLSSAAIIEHHGRDHLKLIDAEAMQRYEIKAVVSPVQRRPGLGIRCAAHRPSPATAIGAKNDAASLPEIVGVSLA